jgi:hypothetical protein
VKREVMRRYDESPEGWQVRIGKDRKGYLDLLISHGGELWQIKEFQVNPYQVVGYGAGTLASQPSLPDTSSYQFGLRPLTESRMRELAGSMDDPRTVVDIMSELLRTKPISTDEAMRSQAILQGPIMQSPRQVDLISESQTQLDRRLSHQLDRLVMRRYRQTLTPYI